ncbi:MAG: dihydroorotate dehydrogenase electron transfer subunit [Gammaproteobacteria bacterium]
MTSHPAHRDSIGLENATVISHQAYAADQFVLRVQAPECAATALPGSFAHLDTGEPGRLRRPISIMRCSPDEGWVEFLYKVLGEGTRLLSQLKVGDTISLLGPIGQPFTLSDRRPRPLLIGGGVGVPPMVFVADAIRRQHPDFQALAILGSEVPFPFEVGRSDIQVTGISTETSACMPLLEDWGIPSRLASLQGYSGCHQGYVTDLARLWLEAISAEERSQVEVYACGPHPMLEAVARLAAEFGLPCQVSLEEYMACAVGGCAGCTVEVQTPEGPAMKRVCVDGPVFDARQVFPFGAQSI